jgi:Ca2+-binding EF-hand superfamily protein
MEPVFSLNRMTNGHFYQMNSKDGERIAARIFQLYDKDANREISAREAKGIIRDIYKGILPNKNLSDDEMQKYFNMLDRNKDGKIKEDDFVAIVNEYFVNENKQGALDKQILNPEIYELSRKTESKVKTTDELRKILIAEGNKRFGTGFMNNQLVQCKKLFDENNLNHNDRLEMNEVFQLFNKIYAKIAYTEKNEKLEKTDFDRLLYMMDFDEDGKISFSEFEIFYLKGILGS